MTYFLRKKGRWSNGESKYIIQNGRKFFGTLPKVDELIRLLKLDTSKDIVSQNKPIIDENDSKKFVLSILSEPESSNKTRTLTEDEKKLLAEMSK